MTGAVRRRLAASPFNICPACMDEEARRHIVDVFLQDYSRRLVEVAAIKPGDRVLDVACGTADPADARDDKDGRPPDEEILVVCALAGGFCGIPRRRLPNRRTSAMSVQGTSPQAEYPGRAALAYALRPSNPEAHQRGETKP